MSNVFLKTLNMSIAASWLILAVVLLRFVLSAPVIKCKKTPRKNVIKWRRGGKKIDSHIPAKSRLVVPKNLSPSAFDDS